MNDANYIGMDVHQATISVAVRDSSGNLVMEAILETKTETILQFIRGLRGSLHVTFEEGTWAAWLIVGHEAPCRISALACRIESRDHTGKEGNSKQVSGTSDASKTQLRLIRS